MNAEVMVDAAETSEVASERGLTEETREASNVDARILRLVGAFEQAHNGRMLTSQHGEGEAQDRGRSRDRPRRDAHW